MIAEATHGTRRTLVRQGRSSDPFDRSQNRRDLQAQGRGRLEVGASTPGCPGEAGRPEGSATTDRVAPEKGEGEQKQGRQRREMPARASLRRSRRELPTAPSTG